MSCIRSSGGVSMRRCASFSVSTRAPTLVRLSRGSGERQTGQPHPTCGTPKLVPVPRNVSLTGAGDRTPAGSHRFDLEEIRRAGRIERHTRCDDYAVSAAREIEAYDCILRAADHLLVCVSMWNELGNHSPYE